MRIALLGAHASQGDAVGNHLAEKVAFFADHGADIRVFVESTDRLHPVVRPYCQTIDPTMLWRTQPSGADRRVPNDAWQFLVSADLVIADFSLSYSLLQLLPLLAGGKPRIVFDYHGVTPASLWSCHHRDHLEKSAQLRGLVWCADRALVHSRFAGAELFPPTGFPADRSSRLGYVIDTDFFTPGPPVQSLRRRLGLDQATFLLFVGRLAPNKRAPVLVEALAHLRAWQPAVHAVLIGPADDLYRLEADKCRHRAADLGLTERLHILGPVDPECLRDAYRSADVFVMPSRHEGFCLPVLEAMACDLPVVAAHAAALPETVGPAGLTFVPDDAADLAGQVYRILSDAPVKQHAAVSNLVAVSYRIVVVSWRYGTDFAGGAETSLRIMAESLQQAGHHVEVFTTCARAEDDWSNRTPEGTSIICGITVQCFPLQPIDRTRFLAAQQKIIEANAPVPDEVERDFLENSVRSSRLLEALRDQIDGFDAVIVGPYLFGLTFDIAREFPAKTLLLPCFHNEPAARLRCFREIYGRVGGMLYHSPEEQELAETELGLNHPGAVCCGTYLDPAPAGDAAHGRQRVGCDRRYLIYGGRYSPHKNLPLLIEYARRYASSRPERFTFVFTGQGSVAIPREPWACDLGFVDEAAHGDLLAGAAALIQLSCLESLSLVALEAWSQGVPVIAHQFCPVMVGHLDRCGGGGAAASYENFAALLDDLGERPEHWKELGRNGQAYVRKEYGSRSTLTRRLDEAIRDLGLPLSERLRRQGRQRVQSHSRSVWRRQFGRIIEEVLDDPPRPFQEQVEVQTRMPQRSVTAGLPALVVPVRVSNRGSHAAVAEGPARTVLRCRLLDEAGQPIGLEGRDTPLPGLVLPGQTVPAALIVPVPQHTGHYQVACWAETLDGGLREPSPNQSPVLNTMQLLVEQAGEKIEGKHGLSLLEAVQNALVPAQQLQQLPDDYDDVTQGWLATWKRRIKKTLLNNFKRAFVDVGFRQQSSFNRHILQVLQELVEFWASRDHALQALDNHRGPTSAAVPDLTPSSPRGQELVEELVSLRQHCALLETRLARLEAILLEREEIRS